MSDCNCCKEEMLIQPADTAWVMHKGGDVVPILGSTKKANLESSIGSVAISLSKEDMTEIEAAVPAHEVAGNKFVGSYEKSYSELVPTTFIMEGL
jgi:diketogulonate reductase-like aldo/keto reductase